MMTFKLSIICVLTILELVSSKRPFNLIFDEFKCTNYGTHVTNLYCHKYDKGNKSFIDVRLVMPIQINYFDIQGSVEIPRADGESIKLLNLTLDGCKHLEDAKSNDLFKVCLQLMRKSGNIPERCPIAANEKISLDGMLVNADVFPTFSPEFNFVANVDFWFNRKIGVKLYINGRVEMKRKQKFFRT